jgi:GNAT superfamily N-acetyltransferase
MTVILEDYRSTWDLDHELSNVGYQAVRGGPDSRPINATVMNSLLRPVSMRATTLALHRDDDGQLLGAAALRWPPTLDSIGWLWGPVVHPSQRGTGLGRGLLDALTEVLAKHPGVKVATSAICETRATACAMFEELGWLIQPSALLVRSLPARLDVPPSLPVRPAQQGEYLHAVLAGLYATARPEDGMTAARDTFARWSADTRYTPAGLLLAEGSHGLAGAVLLYPCTHDTEDEPAEARIEDMITCRKLTEEQAVPLRRTLVAAALAVADRCGATVARAVPPDAQIEAALRWAGFESVDNVRYYVSPG